MPVGGRPGRDSAVPGGEAHDQAAEADHDCHQPAEAPFQQGVEPRVLSVEPGRGLHLPLQEHFDELLLALQQTLDLLEARIDGLPKAADFRGQDTDIVLGRVFARVLAVRLTSCPAW